MTASSSMSARRRERFTALSVMSLILEPSAPLRVPASHGCAPACRGPRMRLPPCEAESAAHAADERARDDLRECMDRLVAQARDAHDGPRAGVAQRCGDDVGGVEPGPVRADPAHLHPVVELRPHEPREHRGDGHGGVRELHGERLRDEQSGALHRRVHAVGPQRGERRHGEDPAPPPLLHAPRGTGAEDRDGPQHHHVAGDELLIVRVAQRRPESEPGIVDEHVDPDAVDEVREVVDPLLGREVDHPHIRADPPAGGQLAGALLEGDAPPRGEDEVIAVGGERPGVLTPQPGAGPGDECPGPTRIRRRAPVRPRHPDWSARCEPCGRRTVRDWAPCATGPRSSWKTPWVTPIPLSPNATSMSAPTGPGTGCRMRWRVRSTLGKKTRCGSSRTAKPFIPSQYFTKPAYAPSGSPSTSGTSV